MEFRAHLENCFVREGRGICMAVGKFFGVEGEREEVEGDHDFYKTEQRKDNS